VQVGTYPTRNFARIFSRVSSESRTLPWLAAVHHRRDATYVLDSFWREVLSSLHEKEHVTELQEVDVLLRLERVAQEEGNDSFPKMLEAPHAVGQSVAVVHSNHAATEKGLQAVKHLRVALVLDDGELRKYLVADLHVSVCVDADMEAALTVDEAHYPVGVEVHDQPRTSSL